MLIFWAVFTLFEKVMLYSQTLLYRRLGLCCHMFLHRHSPQCSWLHWNHLEYFETWRCLDEFGYVMNSDDLFQLKDYRVFKRLKIAVLVCLWFQRSTSLPLWEYSQWAVHWAKLWGHKGCNFKIWICTGGKLFTTIPYCPIVCARPDHVQPQFVSKLFFIGIFNKSFLFGKSVIFLWNFLSTVGERFCFQYIHRKWSLHAQVPLRQCLFYCTETCGSVDQWRPERWPDWRFFTHKGKSNITLRLELWSNHWQMVQ